MDSNKTIPKNTLPKTEKLKSRKAIDALFKNGQSFFIHPYKVFYKVNGQLAVSSFQLTAGNEALGPSNGHLQKLQPVIVPTTARQLSTVQVGFAVSTKNFKHAVDRNRIKRLGREAYRLNKHALIAHITNQQQQLQVFFVFTNKSLPTFAQAQQAMQACLRKLIKTIKKDEGLLQG